MRLYIWWRVVWDGGVKLYITSQYITKQYITVKGSVRVVRDFHVNANRIAMGAAVAAWLGWDTTLTRAYCPALSLFSRTLDRTAVMTYGAHILPDRAFLDRPLEVTPAVLAMEMEDLRSEFRLLTKPMLEWRRQAPGHLAAGHDRLLGGDPSMPGIHLLWRSPSLDGDSRAAWAPQRCDERAPLASAADSPPCETGDSSDGGIGWGPYDPDVTCTDHGSSQTP